MALVCRAGWLGRRRRCYGDGATFEWRIALGDVGVCLAVRAGRHRAGRHQYAGHGAVHRRSSGCRAVACQSRGSAVGRCRLQLRRRHLRSASGCYPAVVAHCEARRENWAGRSLGRWQEHYREPLAALLRPALRLHPYRWTGHCRRHTEQPAVCHRHGDAGHFTPAPLGTREHRLWAARGYGRRDCRGGKTRRSARLHRGSERRQRPYGV